MAVQTSDSSPRSRSSFPSSSSCSSPSSSSSSFSSSSSPSSPSSGYSSSSSPSPPSPACRRLHALASAARDQQRLPPASCPSPPLSSSGSLPSFSGARLPGHGDRAEDPARLQAQNSRLLPRPRSLQLLSQRTAVGPTAFPPPSSIPAFASALPPSVYPRSPGLPPSSFPSSPPQPFSPASLLSLAASGASQRAAGPHSGCGKRHVEADGMQAQGAREAEREWREESRAAAPARPTLESNARVGRKRERGRVGERRAGRSSFPQGRRKVRTANRETDAASAEPSLTAPPENADQRAAKSEHSPHELSIPGAATASAAPQLSGPSLPSPSSTSCIAEEREKVSWSGARSAKRPASEREDRPGSAKKPKGASQKRWAHRAKPSEPISAANLCWDDSPTMQSDAHASASLNAAPSSPGTSPWCVETPRAGPGEARVASSAVSTATTDSETRRPGDSASSGALLETSEAPLHPGGTGETQAPRQENPRKEENLRKEENPEQEENPAKKENRGQEAGEERRGDEAREDVCSPQGESASRVASQQTEEERGGARSLASAHLRPPSLRDVIRLVAAPHRLRVLLEGEGPRERKGRKGGNAAQNGSEGEEERVDCLCCGETCPVCSSAPSAARQLFPWRAALVARQDEASLSFALASAENARRDCGEEATEREVEEGEGEEEGEESVVTPEDWYTIEQLRRCDRGNKFFFLRVPPDITAQTAEMLTEVLLTDVGAFHIFVPFQETREVPAAPPERASPFPSRLPSAPAACDSSPASALLRANAASRSQASACTQRGSEASCGGAGTSQQALETGERGEGRGEKDGEAGSDRQAGAQSEGCMSGDAEGEGLAPSSSGCGGPEKCGERGGEGEGCGVVRDSDEEARNVKEEKRAKGIAEADGETGGEGLPPRGDREGERRQRVDEESIPGGMRNALRVKDEQEVRDAQTEAERLGDSDEEEGRLLDTRLRALLASPRACAVRQRLEGALRRLRLLLSRGESAARADAERPEGAAESAIDRRSASGAGSGDEREENSGRRLRRASEAAIPRGLCPFCQPGADEGGHPGTHQRSPGVSASQCRNNGEDERGEGEENRGKESEEHLQRAGEVNMTEGDTQPERKEEKDEREELQEKTPGRRDALWLLHRLCHVSPASRPSPPTSAAVSSSFSPSCSSASVLFSPATAEQPVTERQSEWPSASPLPELASENLEDARQEDHLFAELLLRLYSSPWRRSLLDACTSRSCLRSSSSRPPSSRGSFLSSSSSFGSEFLPHAFAIPASPASSDGASSPQKADAWSLQRDTNGDGRRLGPPAPGPASSHFSAPAQRLAVERLLAVDEPLPPSQRGLPGPSVASLKDERGVKRVRQTCVLVEPLQATVCLVDPYFHMSRCALLYRKYSAPLSLVSPQEVDSSQETDATNSSPSLPSSPPSPSSPSSSSSVSTLAVPEDDPKRSGPSSDAPARGGRSRGSRGRRGRRGAFSARRGECKRASEAREGGDPGARSLATEETVEARNRAPTEKNASHERGREKEGGRDRTGVALGGEDVKTRKVEEEAGLRCAPLLAPPRKLFRGFLVNHDGTLPQNLASQLLRNREASRDEQRRQQAFLEAEVVEWPSVPAPRRFPDRRRRRYELAITAKRVKLQKSRIHGYGVYAVDWIKAGETIMEYVGQTYAYKQRKGGPDGEEPSLAEIREARYDWQHGNCYIFSLEVDKGPTEGNPNFSKTKFVDATDSGNLARYINHSCEPNCESVRMPHNAVAIVALRDLLPGEELFYDYHFSDKSKEACLCGARTCTGNM
ncbi:putative SET domain-containing protein [Neospora caninum Liverpool]|uniref:Putative SET domain-containing protein n=1 Tax=Neospora caninum (strain Liverpool) TaxID=572307 RepID=F0VN22_NEOCL|nr:putative SET domain-containing protein [Neospora caninum Liverpool]CBZ55118.1 putative SET domain-containing protein [Neospora caninum Liverpool]CEL69844.1 TPA: SET domain-containing protein, putative [Neospora caninum Liverpool]|eukprot:XP_003885146.1 putative SET domain-containing protein [Neospora caninum Liverpool]